MVNQKWFKDITKDDDKGDDKKLKGQSKDEFKIFKKNSRANSRLKRKIWRTLQDSRRRMNSRIKIQGSSFKNQDQDSRFMIQESREDLIKISMKRIFQKLSSTWIFHKNMFTIEFLLYGNRLPDCCNRLPVAKLIWKSFQTKFATFQLISKSYNRLQCFGNRLPVPLNVEFQIQMWRVTSFHIKALCNRLHWFGNRLPVIVSE